MSALLGSFGRGFSSFLALVTEERSVVVLGLVCRRVSLNGEQSFGEALEEVVREGASG